MGSCPGRGGTTFRIGMAASTGPLPPAAVARFMATGTGTNVSASSSSSTSYADGFMPTFP